jgi:hypothetical protein
MGAQRSGSVLIAIGIVGLIVAYQWWEKFYGAVQHFMGSSGPLPIECIYKTSGPCRMVANVAALTGVNAYDPLLFWGAIGAILIGLVLNSNGRAHRADEPHDRRRRRRIEPQP